MRVCVIDCTLDKYMTRGATRKTSSSAYSIGVRCIEDDLLARYGGRALPRAPLSEIRAYDFALLPLVSVQEVESFVVGVADPSYRKNQCRIVAGGAGCVNIHAIADDIDAAVFGRCDAGQILDVLRGADDAGNVWRKKKDPGLTGRYDIGQFAPPKKRFETGTIGCRHRCSYCQYTHIRRHDALPYSPRRGAPETDIWASDFSRPRVHVSAIDGLSEATRLRVRKPISDAFLLDKLAGAFGAASRGKTVGIKLYNIVGYPWETPSTIARDYQALLRMLSGLDRKTGKWRLKITLQNTPFSPEPITPMERRRIRLDDYRDALRGEYAGVDVSVRCTPYLQGPVQRARRVAINRCRAATRERVRRYLRDGGAEIADVIGDVDMPVEYLRRPVAYDAMLEDPCSAP